ncbi:CRISPR-associated protein Cas3 [Thermoanaerobaculum aquaticum]|uniref:CRISPR-associated protein Cas3 n=1 Tax=Thermoanaerobaculum aquaticum TaxID=1312852 RepID=A0A062XM94_9BACT|nr:CRISPR-associated endonuclease Cas3'' [Thermoanaerobaculum aquaticum]KDA53692.1 CRISPR-associated protein Cas3 [Thermoanaerobaculum aquaticum]
MDLEQALVSLWAKAGTPWHPLLAHMLDTAAVAWEILRREPQRTRELYAADWGLDDEEALRFVAFLAGLHDLGKASAVFQASWQEGAARLRELGLAWNQEVVGAGWVAHGVFTELYAGEALLQLGFPRRVADKLAQGLGAHHGFVANQKERRAAMWHVQCEDRNWKSVRQLLVSRFLHTLEMPTTLKPSVNEVSPPAILRVMAIASFADWIASDPQLFPLGRDPRAPDYWRSALALAQEALNRVGWRARTPRAPQSFDRLFPFPPNPLQQAVSFLVSQVNDGPVLLLIEAPMGLGKTEAALHAFHLLREKLAHRGLYLALPTQATANGLFPRVKGFLENLAEGERWELQLQHGTAVLNPLYQDLCERVKPAGVYDPDGEPQAGNDSGGVGASAWFSARKRAMLSGHGVGTVDQALLGVLKVKHHFIRLWGLMNRVVVLDEVHAYDTYTSGLLRALLLWLRSLGSSVVLMTATLPQAKRQELLAAWGAEGVNLPAYPRVAVFAGEKLLGAHTLPLQSRTLNIEDAPVEVSRLAQLLTARLPGALGAIVNTVDRAQALYLALGEGEPLQLGKLLESANGNAGGGPWAELRSLPEQKGSFVVGKRLPDGTLVFLLHARFPAEERSLRETVVLALFGKHGPRPERAILVATQVAEQSLDLDFDLLYSDLAPIDLLFQRAGRLHRHHRERPEGHRAPTLLVGGLKGEPDFGGELFWNRVYEDYVLLSTWLSLQARRQLHLPDDLEPLLEEVYERDPSRFPDAHRDRAESSHKELVERWRQESKTAENLALSSLEKLLRQYDATDLAAAFGLDDEAEDARTQRFLTRLGDVSVPVVPLYRRGDGLFLDAMGQQPARLRGNLTKEETLALWSRVVRISRPPIPQVLLQEDPPPAWQASAVLRGLRPLEVGQEFPGARGRITVSLDPELGVVYKIVKSR